MRRARHPLPTVLRDLRYDTLTHLYEIDEAGITYGMPLELTRLLKVHFKGYVNTFSRKTIAEWYHLLPAEEKKMVIRSGNIPNSNDFHPDPSYD